jgi:hypothetical protein
MSKETHNNELSTEKTLNICCGHLEELNIRWTYLADQTKCIPHIKNIQEDKDFRVNYCPVCGKYVRDAVLKP